MQVARIILFVYLFYHIYFHYDQVLFSLTIKNFKARVYISIVLMILKLNLVVDIKLLSTGQADAHL
jgi:hypothetical protein